MLRVVIADDSPVARDLLRGILSGQDDIEVVGIACDGAEAVELVARLQPDVVTMDVQMPRMDGYAATRQIMVSRPTPIVVVSGSMDTPDVEKSMESLRAGALTLIGKPGSPMSATFDQSAQTLVDTVRMMADVKVIKRHTPLKPTQPAPPPAVPCRSPHEAAVVAIAASTGGPQVVHYILSQLPADYPLPLLLVQHISLGFLDGFVTWLQETLPLRVVIAQQDQLLEPATVYVAPEELHLTVSDQRRIVLSDRPPLDGFRPAATVMFDSVAQAFGSRAIACILTGMGRDGLEGLRAVRREGGFILAQSEETCVVYGMPAVAVAAGLVDRIASPDDIAAALAALTAQQPTQNSRS